MAEYAARRLLAKIDKVANVLAKAIAQGGPESLGARRRLRR
jgi:hypothetical protein